MQFWTDQRATLRSLLAQGEKERERFLHWPLIIGTMFYKPPPDELDYLKSLPNWPQVRELIRDPGVGGAELDPELETNGNIVHHAYSIFRFEQATGRELAGDGTILEIGGGYGNFCRLAFKRGFTGRYVIYDLPEFLELQQWYLGRTLGAAERKKVDFVTALPTGADVIIGLWSISEMPFALRDRIKALAPKYFLIGYQQEFFGLDNVEYFKRWEADGAYRWTHVSIPHIKDNYYLFGARR
jgi:hypothetical protein